MYNRLKCLIVKSCEQKSKPFYAVREFVIRNEDWVSTLSIAERRFIKNCVVPFGRNTSDYNKKYSASEQRLKDETIFKSKIWSHPKCQVCGVDMPVTRYGIFRKPPKNCSIQCWTTSDLKHEKTKETVMSKYGVSNVFASESIKQQIRNTHLENYGVENAAKSRIVQRKTRKTNVERWGGHPSQNEEIKTKTMQRIALSSNIRKSITIKGKIFSGLRGLEPTALEYLISTGVRVKEIKHLPADMPVLNYKDDHGKLRRYFPDFVIGQNVIEVKSTFTAGLVGTRHTIKELKLKFRSVTEAGLYPILLLGAGKGLWIIHTGGKLCVGNLRDALKIARTEHRNVRIHT